MVLVTGATGFIGSNLMCKLAKDNVFPVALFRHESNKERVWKLFKSNFSDAKARFEKITWRKADFRNYPSLSAAFKDITYVYHCAGFISLSHKDAKKLLEINENGTAFLVDLCLENEIKKLVYVSSIAALGNDPTHPIIDENTPWDNHIDKTPYAYSKYGGEMEVWRGMQENLNAVIVNPGIVLGAGSPFEKIMDRYKKGFRWYTSGTHGYVGIDDVVEVVYQLMQSEIQGERFILVAENWSGKALALQLRKMSHHSNRVMHLSKSLLFLFWVLEHIGEFFGLRKRSLTRAMILSQYASKKMNGEKIKRYIDFKYTAVVDFLR